MPRGDRVGKEAIMRVFMLGWEFPPFITGGLGTACYGLTKALDRNGVHVTFVLPKSIDETHSEHIDLVSPRTLPRVPARRSPSAPAPPGKQRLAINSTDGVQ